MIDKDNDLDLAKTNFNRCVFLIPNIQHQTIKSLIPCVPFTYLEEKTGVFVISVRSSFWTHSQILIHSGTQFLATLHSALLGPSVTQQSFELTKLRGCHNAKGTKPELI